MKRNLWRGASPAPAWLGLNQSLCSRASKRWKPLWAGQKREKLSEAEKQYESRAVVLPYWQSGHYLICSLLNCKIQFMESPVHQDFENNVLHVIHFHLYIHQETVSWVFISSECTEIPRIVWEVFPGLAEKNYLLEETVMLLWIFQPFIGEMCQTWSVEEKKCGVYSLHSTITC